MLDSFRLPYYVFSKCAVKLIEKTNRTRPNTSKLNLGCDKVGKISTRLKPNDTSESNKMSTAADDVDAFGTVLGELAGPAYLVDPSRELLRVAVAAARRTERPAELRVVAPGRRLRGFRNSFRVAARTAELVNAGHLEFRSHDSEAGATLLTTESSVHVPLAVKSARRILPVEDDSFQEAAWAWSRERWTAGEEFELHTPPLAAVRETLTAEFGKPVAESFDEAVATVDRGNADEFDPVMAVVLVAARHECQHYDLSRWGEELGFASRATFSRKKNKLERLDVIETEKVSVERGRPRQRLLLTDEYREQARDGIGPLVGNLAY